MPFELVQSPDGYVALLDGAQAAEVVYDPQFRAWTITADRDRFAAPVNLPGVFRGLFTHEVKTLGDVFRFFGVPLPGSAEVERSLIDIAHHRGTTILDRLERDAA
ncbi:hypothetical protein [Methylobacterium gnaphalii]|nr:hypothetical protein [Methylobacterium gnaphalii]GJD68793.1 hypothetical protein MMMDOFMJ_1717 [Methylobacterium gnaphalii]